MPLTPELKFSKAIANARKEAAIHLVKMGYSYRTIAETIGVKSPHSISLYLLSDKKKR